MNFLRNSFIFLLFGIILFLSFGIAKGKDYEKKIIIKNEMADFATSSGGY